jgi:enterochelin esterase-like enzyme
MQREKVNSILFEHHVLSSELLERDVLLDFYLPKNVKVPASMGLLLINDGQDLPKMPFTDMLDDLYFYQKINPLLCVGIHCGTDRKNEYGVASKKDYLGRGARADLYTRFIMEELMPFIKKTYHVHHFSEKAFAGFSLGGLMALDIVWNYPHEFGKVGVFSGSLWWRQKDYKDGYTDEADRIMHNQVKKGNAAPWLKFFFQTGTKDEENDRNGNGVIDSIDDALDLISILHSQGFEKSAVHYLELEEGRHDVATWARAFPEFLKWGWGSKG